MSKRLRLFVMAAMFVGLFIQAAHSAENITQPTATDNWAEGAMGKSIKFNWQNGCSAYQVFINRKDSGTNIFYATHGTAGGNPETYPIGVVPDPGGGSGTAVTVTAKVVITHTDGTSTTIQQDFTITNQ
jgi:hypothetical protein